MSAKENADQELNAVEEALRSLRPHAVTADRDQMMFLAGQASVQLPGGTAPSGYPASAGSGSALNSPLTPHWQSQCHPKDEPRAARTWLWPTAAAAASLAAGILGLAVGLNVSPRVVERIVEVRVPVPSPAEIASSENLAPTDGAPAASRWQPAGREHVDDAAINWVASRRDRPRHAATSYLLLRDQVLARGPDWIPAPPSAGTTSPAVASDLDLRSMRQLSSPLPSGQPPASDSQKGPST